MDWPWSRQRIVKCPDGTTQYIYKNIDDAFPYVFKDAKVSTSAALEGLEKVKGKIDADYESKITHILAQIDEKNCSIQTHLRAAYILYSSSPCTKLNYLEAAIDSIRRDENDLRSAELAMKQLTSVLSQIATSSDSTISIQLGNQLCEVVAALSNQSLTGVLISEMKRVSDNSTRWQKP